MKRLQRTILVALALSVAAVVAAQECPFWYVGTQLPFPTNGPIASITVHEFGSLAELRGTDLAQAEPSSKHHYDEDGRIARIDRHELGEAVFFAYGPQGEIVSKATANLDRQVWQSDYVHLGDGRVEETGSDDLLGSYRTVWQLGPDTVSFVTYLAADRVFTQGSYRFDDLCRLLYEEEVFQGNAELRLQSKYAYLSPDRRLRREGDKTYIVEVLDRDEHGNPLIVAWGVEEDSLDEKVLSIRGVHSYQYEYRQL